MSPVDQIQQLLARQPGLKAQQIADELGLERSQVVSALHSLQGGEVTQDNAYRWWARTPTPQASGAAPAPRSFLASLCRYYLECLSRESGSGISIPSASTGDYVTLSELPFSRPGHDLWAADRALKKLVQKVRREQGQLTLYIGYALRLRPLFVRNQDETRIEPVQSHWFRIASRQHDSGKHDVSWNHHRSCVPILQQSGLILGEELFLGYSPEREDPANPHFTARSIPKVVGANDPSSRQLLGDILFAAFDHIVPVSSCEAAEMSEDS